MQEPDDHMLMAHADGQLDPAMSAEIEALLTRDPVAREKVRRYRDTAALARAAFDPVLDEPVPESLLAGVRAAARRDNVVPLRRRVAARPPLWSLPLAACVALAIGLSGGWWLGRSAAPGPDVLSAALERSTSGTAMVVDGTRIVVASVFPGKDARWCRDFTRQAGEATATGIACRSGEGQWQVEALVPGEDGGAYAPASEEPSALGPTIGAVRAGPALTADQEAALIARGWR